MPEFEVEQSDFRGGLFYESYPYLALISFGLQAYWRLILETGKFWVPKLDRKVDEYQFALPLSWVKLGVRFQFVRN